VEPGDGCNEACKKEFCGDYVVQGSEECDEGDLNSDVKPDACRKDCAAASCGDGVEDTGECDEATFCGSDCKSVAEPGVAEPELDAGAQDTAGAEDAAQAETAEEGPESSGGCGGCEAGEGRGGLPGAALLLAAALVLAASRGRRKSEESGRCGGPECRNLLN
jgi:hypothetical protein